MAELAARRGSELIIPSPALCADNAAMVAVPGDWYLSNGLASTDGFDALPTWPLDRLSERLSAAGLL
jgi:N6-L-threonylcarbamoyladenine synthase